MERRDASPRALPGACALRWNRGITAEARTRPVAAAQLHCCSAAERRRRQVSARAADARRSVALGASNQIHLLFFHRNSVEKAMHLPRPAPSRRAAPARVSQLQPSASDLSWTLPLRGFEASSRLPHSLPPPARVERPFPASSAMCPLPPTTAALSLQAAHVSHLSYRLEPHAGSARPSSRRPPPD